MTQVSGSISLDLSKVVRETTYAVVQEITRTVPTKDENEQGLPTPLAMLANAVTEQVILRLDHDLGGVLAEVRSGLARLEELVQAEAQRRDRLTNGPATGEIPVLNPDGHVAYMAGAGAGAGGDGSGRAGRTVVVYGPGQGPQWAPEEYLEEYQPENDPTRPGMAPVGRMIPDPPEDTP